MTNHEPHDYKTGNDPRYAGSCLVCGRVRKWHWHFAPPIEEEKTMPATPIVTYYASPSAEPAKAVLVNRLRLPIHICLGLYEAATQEELDDIVADLNHERQRREPKDARTP